MAKECQAFFKIVKNLNYISDRTEMTTEKEKAADDLEWGMLEKDKQQEYLTEKIRRKNIQDFLRNDGPPRRRAHDYSTDGMRYITSQMLSRWKSDFSSQVT